MARKRKYPTQEQMEEVEKYKKALRQRGVSNKLISYILGYKQSYVNAIMSCVDVMTLNVRKGFNFIIDLVDGSKKLQNK